MCAALPVSHCNYTAMYIFLDESGDLGFDVREGASNFFIITLLIIPDYQNTKAIEAGVARTLRRKVHAKKRTRGTVTELKGSRTAIGVKQYFFKQLAKCRFGLYCVAVDKQKVKEHMRYDKNRFYNFIARFIIDQIPLDEVESVLVLTVDRTRGEDERREFDDYLVTHIRGRIPLNIPIRIDHLTSHESKGIQTVDVFSWGFFRKYERGDMEWYNCFKDKITLEIQYPTIKKE